MQLVCVCVRACVRACARALSGGPISQFSRMYYVYMYTLYKELKESLWEVMKREKPIH